MIEIQFPDYSEGAYNTLSEALWEVVEELREYPDSDLSEFFMWEDGHPIGAAFDYFKIDGEHVYPTQAMLNVMTRCVIRCIKCGKQALT